MAGRGSTTYYKEPFSTLDFRPDDDRCEFKYQTAMLKSRPHLRTVRGNHHMQERERRKAEKYTDSERRIVEMQTKCRVATERSDVNYQMERQRWEDVGYSLAIQMQKPTVTARKKVIQNTDVSGAPEKKTKKDLNDMEDAYGKLAFSCSQPYQIKWDYTDKNNVKPFHEYPDATKAEKRIREYAAATIFNPEDPAGPPIQLSNPYKSPWNVLPYKAFCSDTSINRPQTQKIIAARLRKCRQIDMGCAELRDRERLVEENIHIARTGTSLSESYEVAGIGSMLSGGGAGGLRYFCDNLNAEGPLVKNCLRPNHQFHDLDENGHEVKIKFYLASILKPRFHDLDENGHEVKIKNPDLMGPDCFKASLRMDPHLFGGRDHHEKKYIFQYPEDKNPVLHGGKGGSAGSCRRHFGAGHPNHPEFAKEGPASVSSKHDKSHNPKGHGYILSWKSPGAPIPAPTKMGIPPPQGKKHVIREARPQPQRH